ncbi:MAG: sodium-dependent bicarbonate transport family permease [Rhodospirillales bacterium]|nr:sodium-dependent bicarbonate transport family permease [Rhodospirillales bacterium]
MQLGKLDAANAPAIAAHSGSVSAVTFIATTAYVHSVGGGHCHAGTGGRSQEW